MDERAKDEVLAAYAAYVAASGATDATALVAEHTATTNAPPMTYDRDRAPQAMARPSGATGVEHDRYAVDDVSENTWGRARRCLSFERQ